MNNTEAGDLQLLAEIEAYETKVWEALVAGDIGADQDALDEQFLGVYPDGFSGKIDHVQQLADGPTVVSYALSYLRVMRLGDDHAVLSYRADFLRKEQAHQDAMYVSSIWRRTANGWVNVFSQDTPALNGTAKT